MMHIQVGLGSVNKWTLVLVLLLTESTSASDAFNSRLRIRTNDVYENFERGPSYPTTMRSRIPSTNLVPSHSSFLDWRLSSPMAISFTKNSNSSLAPQFLQHLAKRALHSDRKPSTLTHDPLLRQGIPHSDPGPRLDPMELVTRHNLTSNGGHIQHFPTGSKLRDEAWVVPLIVLATLNLLVITCFEGFVLVKMLGSRPSRRHFFLGQMLLLGLFLSSLISFAYVTPPNIITCTVVRLGVGLSYACVFATLLVKTIFLISLNSGVYLPAAYHGLLLFFAVGVQLVIGVQWLVHRPPLILFRTVTGALRSTCNTTFDDMLLSLSYAIFLLVFVSVLAIKARRIRDNYREATYIALTMAFAAPLWLIWMVIALVLRAGYEEPCIAFGLVVNGLITFVVMFVPKGRQLAALGKEGLYAEDQEPEERVSSATPPSLYTPSFYHFKPTMTMPRDQPPPATLYKPPVMPVDRTTYPQAHHGRVPRYHVPPYPHHTYYNYDDTVYYSMVRTMTNNPNVHFVRNPMIY